MAYVQYRRLRKRAFHWLIKIDRFHGALHWLELNTNLDAMGALRRNSCRWVRFSCTYVGGQRLDSLGHALGAAVGAGGEPGEDPDHRLFAPPALAPSFLGVERSCPLFLSTQH
uniref:Uncharacterized protein n=1 Tax=Zea mays TaxID=4577 RepID=C0PI45_MAIZE|nr:unknown [Zea mays]